MADCEVPWYPRSFNPDEDVKVVHLGVDPLWERYPIRTFPAQLAIPGSTRAALELLDAALHQPACQSPSRSAAAQRSRTSTSLRAQRGLQRSSGRVPRSRSAMHMPATACARRCRNEPSSSPSSACPTDYLQLEEPGSLLGVSIGGGLGFGLGASLGAKLAAPDRTVISTIGDGSYMFGNPTPFHFVARAANLPVLTIICNNCRWQAVDSATRVVYPQGLAAAATPAMPLVELKPSPEFTKVAEASDAWTRRVDDPADLPGAIDAGLEAVAGGRQALLDVRMEHGIR